MSVVWCPARSAEQVRNRSTCLFAAVHHHRDVQSAADADNEIHRFTTDGAGDYRITVSNFSDDASLLWYLFGSEQNAVDYFRGTNLPGLVIADGNVVGENPQVARTGDLSGDTTYYLGIESFRGAMGVGSDYTVNVSAAD